MLPESVALGAETRNLGFGTLHCSRHTETRSAEDSRCSVRSRREEAAREYEEHSESAKSDPMKNVWHRRVYNGTLTLRQAQKLELAYKRNHG